MCDQGKVVWFSVVCLQDRLALAAPFWFAESDGIFKIGVFCHAYFDEEGDIPDSNSSI